MLYKRREGSLQFDIIFCNISNLQIAWLNRLNYNDVNFDKIKKIKRDDP